MYIRDALKLMQNEPVSDHRVTLGGPMAGKCTMLKKTMVVEPDMLEAVKEIFGFRFKIEEHEQPSSFQQLIIRHHIDSIV